MFGLARVDARKIGLKGIFWAGQAEFRRTEWLVEGGGRGMELVRREWNEEGQK